MDKEQKRGVVSIELKEKVIDDLTKVGKDHPSEGDFQDIAAKYGITTRQAEYYWENFLQHGKPCRRKRTGHGTIKMKKNKAAKSDGLKKNHDLTPLDFCKILLEYINAPKMSASEMMGKYSISRSQFYNILDDFGTSGLVMSKIKIFDFRKYHKNFEILTLLRYMRFKNSKANCIIELKPYERSVYDHLSRILREWLEKRIGQHEKKNRRK